MEWRDDGIILGLRRHGESSAIVELFTQGRGRHLGLVRGGRSKRMQVVLQPGNSVHATWRARLDEHLGAYAVEPDVSRAADLMESRLALYGFATLAAPLRLLPERDPGRTTEALIELGATVCTPTKPTCGACPLRPACAAAHAGDPEAYPAPRRRGPAPRRERWALVALDRRGRLWLERRPDDGLLAGLWGFPQLEDRPRGRTLEPIEQTYSHFRLHLTPVLVDPGVPAPEPLRPSTGAETGADAGWFGPDALPTLALSRVDRRLVRRLRDGGLLASDA